MANTAQLQRLRVHAILRVMLRRVLDAEDWFTIPTVSCGIDAMILPTVVPHPCERMIKRMAAEGLLETGIRRYRLRDVFVRTYVEALLVRNKDTDHLLEVLSSPST